MEKVVYILGAGFSAPLGVPVMGNFLFKSKDLYATDPEKYAHFRHVFDLINKLSTIKNYYNADLFNIEEVLSIIEMNEFLEGKKLQVDFINYIRDVVRHYTPRFTDMDLPSAANWEAFIFGRNKTNALYGYFVAGLWGLKIERRESNRIITNRNYDFVIERSSSPTTAYSVLSLNYDLVLESISSAIKNTYISNSEIRFNKSSYDSTWTSPHLAKLHGCLDGPQIVPPTWSKGTHEGIIPTWKNAFQILGDANHIRIMGYSLPLADSYIKYLLKSAVIHAKNLKSIDVVCLDADGSVKARYDAFFEFRSYSFVNGSVLDYLEELKKLTDSSKPIGRQHMSLDWLESAHRRYASPV